MNINNVSKAGPLIILGPVVLAASLALLCCTGEILARFFLVEKVKSENLVAMQWQAVEAEEEGARSKLVVDKEPARGQALGGTRCSHVLQSQPGKHFYGPSKFKTFE